MQIKTYRAPSMKAAIAAVKEGLGPDAVVLSTRTIRGDNPLLGKSAIEITAALDPDVAREAAVNARPKDTGRVNVMLDDGPMGAMADTLIAASTPSPARSNGHANGRANGHGYTHDGASASHAPIKSSRDLMKEARDRALRGEFTAEPGLQDRIELLTEQVQRLAQMMGQGSPEQARAAQDLIPSLADIARTCAPERPAAYDALMAQLLDSAVEHELADRIIRDAMTGVDNPAMVDDFTALEHVAQQIMDRTHLFDPFEAVGQRQVRCAFVGATGVGKTTTLAKLASSHVLDRGRRAAFFTIDTFRVGAVEQLRTYARILGVPLEIIRSEEEMAEKLAKHADKDGIFVDTAGVSQKDTPLINKMADCLHGHAMMDIHLVASATTQYKDLLEIAENYGRLPITSLIGTKLDESNAMGGIYNLMHKYNWPLSYFTIGQNVPDDIEKATSERVCDQLLDITAH
ncbi:MAG: flagellar biosynthesis protein FlhF [Deltaproteobacteria bacterium]|nr:flagellar biosynthesis protein FlhF [Deltaproteobacteria bacterium]